MHLSTLIARRYLLARKSHNVINIISLISGIGIAVGTCALIIVMSVYNGFEDIVKGVYKGTEADFIIYPAYGKCFSPQCGAVDSIRASRFTSEVFEVVSEKVFVTYSHSQGIATVKGVDTTYRKSTISDNITEGKFLLYEGEIPSAVVGRGLAQKMRISPRFVDPVNLYLPSRTRKISLVNPMSSLNTARLFPAGVISIEQNMDKESIFIPIEYARELSEYTDEVSYLEINIKEGSDQRAAEKEFRDILGDRFLLKNRYQQNETVYKMMKYEKAAIYVILLFIIIIISCNVFGSLTMLIIEKKDDIETLRSMGARESLLKRIFIQEGWMITLYGIAAGTIVGVFLTLIQEVFGVIRLPGNYIVSYYPVSLQIQDILLTVFSVALIGFVIACIPSLKTFSKKMHNF